MKSSLWKLLPDQENEMERLCDFDIAEHGTDIKVVNICQNCGAGAEIQLQS